MLMRYFRQINRRTSIGCSLLLALLLLSGPGGKLHSHHLDIENGSNSDHIHSIEMETSKTYLSKPHFAHDLSHEHKHEVVSEVEVQNNGLLKNINNSVLALAIIMLFGSLMISTPARLLIQRRRENKLILYDYYRISPPLRAPPIN